MPSQLGTALLWTAVLPLACLVFVLTGSVVLATLIPALQAAQPSLRTGCWLYWHERKKSRSLIRATTILVFYVANAFWMAAATGLLTVFVIMFAASKFGVQPDLTSFITAMLIIVVGVTATTCLGCVATVCAYRYRLRIWVHPRTYAWCRGEPQRLPTLHMHSSRFNHAIFVVAASVVAPGLIAGALALILITATGKDIGVLQSAAAVFTAVLFFAVYPVGSVLAYTHLSDRIIAADPGQS